MNFILLGAKSLYTTQLALCIHTFHIHEFNHRGLKILKKKKKIPESSKEQNLNLPHTGNYLHIIYIVFTTFLHNIDIVLGIISNLEVI